MGIIEYKKEQGDIQPIESLAQTIFNQQLKDITNISHTDWYKEIKRYWKTVLEWAELELKTVKPEFLNIVQSKCLIADWFLTFLENIEKTKEVSNQVKK